MKLVLTLNNSSKISSIGVKVNNSSTEVTRNEINDNKFTIEFPIMALTDSINIKAYVKSTWFNNTYSSDFIINRIMDDETYLLDVDLYNQGEKEDSKAKSFIEKSEDEIIEIVKNIAIDNKMNIGLGFAVKIDEKGENKYAIISKEGKVLVNYTKIHPFTFGGEDKRYYKGNHIDTCTINIILYI